MTRPSPRAGSSSLKHLAKLNQICIVARQFGPRAGNFPLIEEYANSDNYRLEDSAIWCAGGNSLEADKRRLPLAGHASPITFVRSALEAQHAG